MRFNRCKQTSKTDDNLFSTRKVHGNFKDVTGSASIHNVSESLREVVEFQRKDYSTGIFPLPANKVGLVLRPNDSVVPEMFYKQEKNVSLHEFR